MAVESKKRKRLKNSVEKKFLVGEKVEVRSEEDGFLGSWHLGTVIACSTHSRRVKYDHLLKNNGYDNLVQAVHLTSIIDAASSANASQCQKRGNIRPLPPPCEFENLRYGVCVDMYYNEAWWEGVIFDNNDGSEQRKIFFPDLGDEMLARIDSLRITQDWDEFKESWHPRGSWLFLELLEEFKQVSYIPVSEKQIWYDLRDKDGFEKIEEWTSSARQLWKELLSEVIADNLKIVIDGISSQLELPESTEQEIQPLLEYVRPGNDDALYPEVDLYESHDSHATPLAENPGNTNAINLSYPSIHKSDQNQLTVCVSEDVGLDMIESDRYCDGESENVFPQPLVVLPSFPEGNSGFTATSNGDSEVFFSTKSDKIHGEYKSSRCPKIRIKLPASPNIVPEAKFLPHAIAKYAQAGKKSGMYALAKDVKKHLMHLKWKIECRKNDKGVSRKRYISPDGKHYHSLTEVCRHLIGTSMKILSPTSQDDKKVPRIAPDVLYSPPVELPGVYPSPDNCPLAVDSPPPDVVFVEPKCNPQAVEDWYLLGIDENRKSTIKKSDVALQARKHLSFLGWVFKYVMTSTGKRLYTFSPKGKCYNSLRQACKAFVSGERGSESIASTFGTKKSTTIRDKDKDQLVSKKLCYAVSNGEFHEHLVPSNALSKNLSMESCISQPRKLKRKRKSNASHFLLMQANSTNASLLKFQEEKYSRALITSEEDPVHSRQARVLRSSKRVRQFKLPSQTNQIPLTVVSWLIDNDVVLPRQKVLYRAATILRPNVGGRLTRDGIKCNCCRKIYTPSSFQAHAGSSYSSPAARIFLEDGRSLLDCQLQVLNKLNMRNFGEQYDKLKGNHRHGDNDYICSICHFGGELILCDRCPSSFHSSCLGLKDVPDGDWFCPSCCCGICGSKFGGGVENVLICYQCEHKYHGECLSKRGASMSGFYLKKNWFCSKKCQEIYVGLKKLVGKPFRIGVNNLTWTLLKSKQSVRLKLDASEVEALSRLNLALSVMHECFEHVNEPRTGRDLVEDVIFSRRSELNRLNFQGFYTILLERDEELVTVATVRVFGEKAAEVPLIGTRFRYRRLGMCRILMNELEKKLMELGVQRLILPAIPSVLNTWTSSFGFSRMTHSERLNFLDNTFLDFQGTIMCQKLLSKSPSAELKPRGPSAMIQAGICEIGNTLDLDRSITVSEVYQGEQIEESGSVELEQDLDQYVLKVNPSKPESKAIFKNTSSNSGGGRGHGHGHGRKRMRVSAGENKVWIPLTADSNKLRNVTTSVEDCIPS